MTKNLWMLASAGVLAGSAPAIADEAIVYEPSDYAWTDARKLTVVGVSGSVGGGFAGFTDGFTNDNLRNAVTWAARLAIGTHIPIGLELGYSGMTGDFVTAVGVDTDFHGRNLDTLVRWNVLPHMALTPYLLAGVSWQHYSAEPDTGASGGFDVDEAAMPLAVGFAYRMDNGFMFDVRGSYRIIDEPQAFRDSEMSLDSWDATASVGYDI